MLAGPNLASCTSTDLFEIFGFSFFFLYSLFFYSFILFLFFLSTPFLLGALCLFWVRHTNNCCSSHSNWVSITKKRKIEKAARAQKKITPSWSDCIKISLFIFPSLFLFLFFPSLQLLLFFSINPFPSFKRLKMSLNTVITLALLLKKVTELIAKTT